MNEFERMVSAMRDAQKLFPTILIALDIAASVPYACHGDWRRFVYWLAAATLTACVTY